MEPSIRTWKAPLRLIGTKMQKNALLDLYKEVENVVVVGLSMGGLVSLELAARHRDKVAGVALVAALRCRSMAS